MKPQWSHGIGPQTMNICHSPMKMVSLDPDWDTGQEGKYIYAQTWTKMVTLELWASFWCTKTNNRSINLETTTTIWLALKGERAHSLSLPNQLEVHVYYYILPNQHKHHPGSDTSNSHSQDNKNRHLWNHNDPMVSVLKLWIFVTAPWKWFH